MSLQPELRPIPRTDEHEAEAAGGLGARLRAERERLRRSIAEVEHDTRINRLYIEAIEEERFEVLPAPVYARGFVRSYARYLGFDPEEAVAAIPKDLPRPEGLEPIAGLRRRAPGVAVRMPDLQPRAIIVGGVATAAVVAVVAFALLGGLGRAPAVADPVATPAAGATIAPFAPGTTPDLVGVPRGDALAALERIGASVVELEGTSDEQPSGHVFLQSPAPGEALDPGDTVTLVIAR